MKVMRVLVVTAFCMMLMAGAYATEVAGKDYMPPNPEVYEEEEVPVVGHDREY